MFCKPFVALALIAGVSASVSAQPRAAEPKRLGLDEQAELLRLVDAAASGKPAGGDAWLKWVPHFLRGPEGRTYVPFTLTIDEAPGAFEAAAVYVRVAPRGDEGRNGRKADGVKNILGVATGEIPVSTPDRRQGAGAPTAAESSMMLRSLTSKAQAGGYPFEDAFAVVPRPDESGGPARFRRALAVPPGEYDLYIAVLERGGAGKPKWAVLKEALSIPDLSSEGLRISSVIIADKVEALAGPIPAVEQTRRPYALGTAELFPAPDTSLAPAETLHVAFLIYDAAVDGQGKPDVRIDYHLYEQTFSSERLLGATAPQLLDASTVPATFDLRKGQLLAAMQSLPLARYKPGAYRLAIRVTDNRTGGAAEQHVRFTISDEASMR